MNEALRKDIEAFVTQHTEAVFRDIARLVAVDSVEGEAAPGAPFGAGPRKALDLGLAIARELGLGTVDCEGKLGYAYVGEDCDRYLATITHLDVVPVGDGWKEDPFTMREREGWIIGRGVMDDKGPSVLCLYALKYLKDKHIPLRYPVRALLGANEETGMGDVEHYLANYPAPLFCFSPDANFPLCNGEKGIYHGRILSRLPLGDILDIHGGVAPNVIPDKAEATVRAAKLAGSELVDACETEPGVWHLLAHGKGGHASLPAGTRNAIGVLVDYLLANGVGDENDRAFLRLIEKLHRAWDGSALGVEADDGNFEPLTIVGGVISPLFNVYTVVNKLKWNSIITLVMGVVNTLLVFLLLNTTGLGVYAVAGTSTVLGIIKNLTFTPMYAAHCLGIPKKPFYPTIIRYTLVSILMIGVFSLLAAFLPADTWLMLFVSILICGIAGSILNLAFLFGAKERRMLFDMLKKFIRRA